MTDGRHRLAKMLKRLSYMLQIQKKQTDKQVFLLFCRISYVLIVLPTVSKEKGAAPLLEQAVYRIFFLKHYLPESAYLEGIVRMGRQLCGQ